MLTHEASEKTHSLIINNSFSIILTIPQITKNKSKKSYVFFSKPIEDVNKPAFENGNSKDI